MASSKIKVAASEIAIEPRRISDPVAHLLLSYDDGRDIRFAM